MIRLPIEWIKEVSQGVGRFYFVCYGVGPFYDARYLRFRSGCIDVVDPKTRERIVIREGPYLAAAPYYTTYLGSGAGVGVISVQGGRNTYETYYLGDDQGFDWSLMDFFQHRGWSVFLNPQLNGGLSVLEGFLDVIEEPLEGVRFSCSDFIDWTEPFSELCVEFYTKKHTWKVYPKCFYVHEGDTGSEVTPNGDVTTLVMDYSGSLRTVSKYEPGPQWYSKAGGRLLVERLWPYVLGMVTKVRGEVNE